MWRSRHGFRKMHAMAKRLAFAASAAAVVFLATTGLVAGQAGRTGPMWVTAWGTSQQSLGDTALTNATIRMIARVTIPGQRIRVRLDNAYNTDPVIIGHAAVGYRVRGAAVAAGSTRELTFSGAASVTIPPNGTAWSDAVALPVLAQQDLAVSLFSAGANVKPSQHAGAVVTSYRATDGSGDVVLNESQTPFTGTTTSMWWLKAIDVETDSSASAVVAFGDSITDGTCTTLDAHDRWQDIVSMRLTLQSDARKIAIVNEGIGGNTVTREGLTPPAVSTPGIERFDRDVLGHHGVSHVVLFMGTNDINRAQSAARVIEGLSWLISRVKGSGMRAIGVTIVPRHQTAASGSALPGWTPQKTAIRNEVNQWIRSKAPFDGVIDFDAVVQNPTDPNVLNPPFNCGDNVHPSPAGYFAMGNAVDLKLFLR
jgi:lysophospholipase L1-like esterase